MSSLSYTGKVEAIFRVSRHDEEKRLQACELNNHMLLFHGSSTSNLISILKQGLKVAPPEAPTTGYSFGKVCTFWNHNCEFIFLHLFTDLCCKDFAPFVTMNFSYFINECICEGVLFNSYSASHDNWCTATLWNRIMTAQCEGMGEVGSARYEPALLPPCPSIRALCYSNCQRSTHSHQQSKV